MIIQKLADYVRMETKTTVTSFPDSEFLLRLEATLPEFMQKLEFLNEGYTGSIQVRDLKATGTGWDEGTGTFTREYPFPALMLGRMEKLEAKIKNNFTEWVELEEEVLDLDKIPSDETSILANYTNKYKFKIFRNSIFLLTGEITEAIEEGLKLHCYTDVAPITNLSSPADLSLSISAGGIGLPRVLHKYLGDAIVIDWKESKDKPIALTKKQAMYDTLLEQALQRLKNKNRKREIKADTTHIEDIKSDFGYND